MTPVPKTFFPSLSSSLTPLAGTLAAMSCTNTSASRREDLTISSRSLRITSVVASRSSSPTLMMHTPALPLAKGISISWVIGLYLAYLSMVTSQVLSGAISSMSSPSTRPTAWVLRKYASRSTKYCLKVSFSMLRTLTLTLAASPVRNLRSVRTSRCFCVITATRARALAAQEPHVSRR